MTDAAPVGAGAAPRPSPPPPDGSLRIQGGVGGISFQLEELARGADQLDAVVGQLLGIEEEALRVQDALLPYLSDSFDSGSLAIDEVAESRKDVGRSRQALGEVSASVRASHREYAETEVRNSRLHLLGPGAMMFPAPGSLFRPGRDLTEDALNLVINPGFEAEQVLGAVLGLPLLARFQPRPVSVTKVGETAEQVQPSIAGSLRRLEKVYDANDGEIEVIEFDNNGSSSWMVLIPGTQPHTPSSNPFDIQGIGEAVGFGSEDVVPAVAQALREAGAETGDPVVAVGHSQGGVHAMNLSRNKAFLSEFDLKFVLTAGAPVGDITPEPGISSLHLEHVQDWVPGTDGHMNPDTKDRVTVTLTDEVKTPDGEDPGLGPGHDQENYAKGAELVAASNDPSLVASTAAFAGVVGVGGAAKVTRFKLTRDPLPDHRSSATVPGLPESRSTAGAR
ncbi:PE-PPE domain-containing protein [Paenarthrobacter sp. JL.01a]|uniref:PE-PPE domain-containing protein n=1 Tax=Paenarthrobacter sp. JL.01a TaxID=2979324 RepID=UPI0021C7A879|nr:PE-PPE domain-containing protein [Paenarthrobacter sp. JL.01a]UXM91459.1 PE-PPE domain-containing protein [Paenarthrobacter sp. JL.01a]